MLYGDKLSARWGNGTSLSPEFHARRHSARSGKKNGGIFVRRGAQRFAPVFDALARVTSGRDKASQVFHLL